MTTTSHALAGAMIASLVKRPYLAIPLAFLSHFVCDAIPHFGIGMAFGGPTMFAWLLIDGFLACVFAIFLLKKKVQNPVLLAICGFAAMSPDLAWLYYGLKGNLNNFSAFDPITKFHSTIQWFEHPVGILLEVVWIAVMVTIILKANHENYKDTATSKA